VVVAIIDLLAPAADATHKQLLAEGAQRAARQARIIAGSRSTSATTRFDPVGFAKPDLLTALAPPIFPVEENTMIGIR
jgi:hypothetical protein